MFMHTIYTPMYIYTPFDPIYYTSTNEVRAVIANIHTYHTCGMFRYVIVMYKQTQTASAVSFCLEHFNIYGVWYFTHTILSETRIVYTGQYTYSMHTVYHTLHYTLPTRLFVLFMSRTLATHHTKQCTPNDIKARTKSSIPTRICCDHHHPNITYPLKCQLQLSH